MKWEEHYDEDNNMFWKANYYYSYFIIRQKLKSNRIVFIEDSAPELWLDKFAAYREEWNSLQGAKYDMYRHSLSLTKQYNDNK
jgi:hypothetical protein